MDEMKRDITAEAYLHWLQRQPRQYGTGCAPSTRPSGKPAVTWSQAVDKKLLDKNREKS